MHAFVCYLLSALSRFFHLLSQKNITFHVLSERQQHLTRYLTVPFTPLASIVCVCAGVLVCAFCAVGKCHPFYQSICTTSWKRATLLFTCLPAMLHRGLIRGVDRSCNLKRGHCSSEQKQLKENERRPPRVKNRKLSTCKLESTAHHHHSHPPVRAPPPKLAGPALLCMIRSASSSSKLLVTF